MIILIAAVAENFALGKNNQLLWHLPKDFRRFKEVTSGHFIIMGRKTFESFPKPLPNRTHVIITRQEHYASEGCIVAKDIESAIAICPKNDAIYIIGGGEIYAQSMDIVDALDITKVHHTFDADVYFPKIDAANWDLKSDIFNAKDESHLYDFSFQTYVRKQ